MLNRSVKGHELESFLTISDKETRDPSHSSGQSALEMGGETRELK